MDYPEFLTNSKLSLGLELAVDCGASLRCPRHAFAKKQNFWRDNAAVWVRGALVLFLTGAALGSVVAADRTSTVPAAGKAGSGRPGAWDGLWEVTRDHPQITTRGGSQTLLLHIRHDTNGSIPHVAWTADRGLCESPVAPPCEWVGERGVASNARVVAGNLLVVMHISADESDPFVVWLERPQEGRSRGGSLISARGGLTYRLDADRQ